MKTKPGSNTDRLKTTDSGRLQRLVSFAQWIPVVGLFLAPTISNFSKYKSIIDDHYVSSLAWHMVTFGISLGLLLRWVN